MDDFKYYPLMSNLLGFHINSNNKDVVCMHRNKRFYAGTLDVIEIAL